VGGVLLCEVLMVVPDFYEFPFVFFEALGLGVSDFVCSSLIYRIWETCKWMTFGDFW
jgi:hypothetical protein